MSPSARNAIVLYLVFLALIISLKPTMFYDRKGDVRTFGRGEHETLFPLPVMAIIIAIFVFYFVILMSDLYE